MARLNGVDIASYQKDMDCSKIDADFVIIKATQGNTYVNPNCNRQYAQAKKAGKLLGLYHYATGIGAEVEAAFFVDNIRGYVKEAILCIDWEHNEKGGKNPVFNTTGEVDYVYRFAKRVHEMTGVYPLVYMSASVTRRRDWTKVASICELWDAQYASATKLTGYQESPWRDTKGLGAWHEPPAIHQYSSSGTIKGYEQTSPNKLDLDIAYLTREDWMALAKGTYRLVGPIPVTPSLVLEVLDGKYGTGASRVANLKAAGYNPEQVQKKINELYIIAHDIKKFQPKVGEYWGCVLKLL